MPENKPLKLWHMLSVVLIAGMINVTTLVQASAQTLIRASNVSNATTSFTTTLAVYVGGTAQISSVNYTIAPKSGSFTRPFTANFSQSYLQSKGDLSTTPINGQSYKYVYYILIPVFGLYAGSNNLVGFTVYFSDGTSVTSSSPLTVSTLGYTDPCGAINTPVIRQYRTSTSRIPYDYFLLKDECSTNSPAIFDTDGNIRWVAQANVAAQASTLYQNYIYASDNKTGINKIDLTTQKVVNHYDYSSSPYNITFTGHHNIDPGRDGIIVDVNTTNEIESVDIEIDGNGNIIRQWDMGAIISAAMTAGGDNPAQFVYEDGKTDWFHNNAVTYNPADNTLIVSSRENFVIAVPYDATANGAPRGISWIFGDTTKKWWTFPSLKAFALSIANDNGTANYQYAPIGQHGVSIDTKGNLLLFNDGYGSGFQSPTGYSRTYSFAESFLINNTTTSQYLPPKSVTLQNYYSPNPTIFSKICGSVYDTKGAWLVDFATATVNGVSTAEIQGLDGSFQLVFDLQFPQQDTCGAGWNVLPIPSTFNF